MLFYSRFLLREWKYMRVAIFSKNNTVLIYFVLLFQRLLKRMEESVPLDPKLLPLLAKPSCTEKQGRAVS
jgi:hypothetical protein